MLDPVTPPGAPDIEMCAPVTTSTTPSKNFLKNSLSLGTLHIQPTSRGVINLKDASIWTHPLINPKYISTEIDRRAMMFGLKTALKVVETVPLAGEN